MVLAEAARHTSAPDELRSGLTYRMSQDSLKTASGRNDYEHEYKLEAGHYYVRLE